MQDEFDFELINAKPQQSSPQPAQEPLPEPQGEMQPEDKPEVPAQPAKKKLTRAQSFFKDIRDVLVIVCVFMLVYMLLFRNVVVVGSSMYDTLQEGDYLIILNNLVYREPKQGDIIVASKDSFRGGECIIKRVIATEGQLIDIDFHTGTVYVDGKALDEPYLYTPTTGSAEMTFPLLVPEGCLFVMGDNRKDSMDSRDPQIGLIDQREILGRAIFLMLPGKDHNGDRDLGRIGVID